jgi:hypothetical protein
VILRDVDLRGYIEDIFNSDLPSMREVKVIKVERCKIERFVPRMLGDKVKEISLEGNKLTGLEVEFGRKIKNRYNLGGVRLRVLNLS